ncbi:MAG TPA: amidohydrolase family protein [Phycisphaerae bacterium]|nr:amidohydrolase family protein [Phycisphaerae bacterium]
MIIDCYTHVWDSPGQLGRLASVGSRAGVVPAGHPRGETPNAGTARHLAVAEQVDATIVLGFRSEYLDAEIPNDAVAAYVRTHPKKLIGFAGVDPSSPAHAVEELERARTELGMKGVALSPAAQNLHPCSSKSEVIYSRAAELGLPVLFNPGVQIASECVLEFAQPVLLDEVARSFPSLRIVIAHLGYPWIRETLVLLAKHEHVYADISWLLHQPWEAYQALLSAHQFGVMGKLLFGSGFPFSSPAQSIETLYGLNHLCGGTNLPRIPREALRGIVERDALKLLGITHVLAVERVASTGDDLATEDELS